MSDDALRRLARAVADGGDVADRLRYARALAQASRPQQAIDVLLPMAGERGVREELVALASRVRPQLAESPTVLWEREGLPLFWPLMSDSNPADVPGFLGASPLALLAGGRGRGAHVLDPANGARRWAVPWAVAATALSLIATGGWVMDPVSGEVQNQEPLFADDLLANDEHLLVAQSGHELRAFTRGAAPSCWEFAWSRLLGGDEERIMAALGHHVFVHEWSRSLPTRLSILSRATGEVLWQGRAPSAESLLAWGDTALLQTFGGMLLALGEDGSRSWAREGTAPQAVSGGVVACLPDELDDSDEEDDEQEAEAPRPLLLLDARSGEVEAEVGVLARQVRAAGDGFYVWNAPVFREVADAERYEQRGEWSVEHALYAIDLEGQVRWSLAAERVGAVLDLAVVGRRAYVLTSRKLLLCLGPEPQP